MPIYLKPVTLQDGHKIVLWRNDDIVKSHCLTKSVVTEESNKQFFRDYVETGKYKQFMVYYVDEYLPMVSYAIASVYLKDMDYGNKRCELCVFTSCDKEWKSEQITDSIKQLLHKAFYEYDMHKVYTYVFVKFPEEIDILEEAGFVKEGLLKGESLNERGEYEDILRMAIFKPL